MHYLNVKVDTIRSPEAASCTDAQMGAWLRLSTFSAEKENGGRILNCGGWSPTVWQRLVGIDTEAFEADCPLWTWDGDDLVVSMYPVEQEEKFRLYRNIGRKGGRPSKSPTPDKDEDKDKDKEEDKEGIGSAIGLAIGKPIGLSDTPTPPPKSSGLAVPVKPTKASPATTYELTDEEVGNLQQLHPTVDVVAVINDYQRKVAAHVKQPYTAAKLLGGLDAWCSHGPDHRAKDGGTKGGNGNRDGWMQPTPVHEYGFSMNEWELHHMKPEWSEYMSEESDRCGWGAELAPWLSFEEWKRARLAVQ